MYVEKLYSLELESINKLCHVYGLIFLFKWRLKEEENWHVLTYIVVFPIPSSVVDHYTTLRTPSVPCRSKIKDVGPIQQLRLMKKQQNYWIHVWNTTKIIGFVSKLIECKNNKFAPCLIGRASFILIFIERDPRKFVWRMEWISNII